MAANSTFSTLYAGGSFTTIAGDYNINVHAPRKSTKEALKLLHSQIVPGAFHNSAERFDAPKCHPHTREGVLREIKSWVEEGSHQYPVLWMYGPAGTGKSSIAQSIAEILEKDGQLAASFFFSRIAAGRNTETHFIATIAHQLNIHMPKIAEFLAEAINCDLSLFSRSVQAQLDALVVQPLTRLCQNGAFGGQRMGRRRLVIIDGLDECGHGKSQRQILSALFKAIQNSLFPLCFLIASRSEHEIRMFFNQELVTTLARRLVLDDKYEPDNDIRLFLRSKFDEIKRYHPSRAHIPLIWPANSDIEQLVQKASGQFIYASTVMKFVESPRHWPEDRLKIVLGLTSPRDSKPFADLDALYSHILASVEDIERVMDTFTLLLLWPVITADMGSTEDFLLFRRGELKIIFTDLHSLVYVPPASQPSQRFHFFHASLRDFLMDRSRSGKFFLDEGEGHARIARYCIKYLADPDTSDLMLLSFTAIGFMQHCSMSSLTKEFHDDLCDFNFEKYLEALFGPYYGFLFGFKTASSLLPSFFKWIQAQPGLNRKYMAHFDDYLRARLAQYPQTPASFHLFTASTLNSFPEHCSHLFNFLARRNAFDLYGPDERGVRFRFAGVDLEEDGYYRMVTDFLTDVNRSGIYHVNDVAYMTLGQTLVDALVDPHTSAIQGGRYLDCLLEILLIIPGKIEMAQYLRHKLCVESLKRKISLIKQADAFLAIQSYIEKCDRDTRTSDRIPTSTVSVTVTTTPRVLEQSVSSQSDTTAPSALYLSGFDGELFSPLESLTLLPTDNSKITEKDLHVLTEPKRSLKRHIATWFRKKMYRQ